MPQQLISALGDASRALQRLHIAQTRASGLGMLEFLVLSRAAESNGVTPGEVPGGNFSINVSGGNYFDGCYLKNNSWNCDAETFIQGGTTGPLVRSVLGNVKVYAGIDTGGPEDTTLYFPYPGT